MLFGGSPGTGTGPLDDTWEYDGTWTHIATTVQPPARRDAAMAYDVATRQTVLFGGGDVTTIFGDHWAWDGASWQQLTSAIAPSPRQLHAMVTDPIGHRVVLVGGVFVPGDPETWLWDGTSWLKAPPVAIPATPISQVALDALRGRALVVSTVSGAGSSTFEFDGNTWIHRGDSTTLASDGAALAFDQDEQRAILFGGLDPLTFSTSNDTSAWDGGAWTKLAPAHAPSPRLDAAMAFDAKHRQMLLFGGMDSAGTALSETWVWHGGDWTRSSPTHVPAPRQQFGLAYDPIREQVVLFGGAAGSTGPPYGDTWIWTGDDWTQLAPPRSPSPRSGTQLAWDAARQQLVLFGGANLIQPLGDAWGWDGATWAPITTVSNAPTSRSPAGAFPSPFGFGTLVFGDGVGSTDTWRLAWSRNAPVESCRDASDRDGDGLAGCADPDCWWACTPLCPPGAACASDGPRCGDGVCNAALENCRSCPQDCACAPTCGDFYCDPGEAIASCPGDCTP